VLMNKSEIEGKIPHAGAMCLLDGVVAWDATKIRCVTRTHQNENNPMRANGQLSAVCGVEYAAQAMAIHGGLTVVAGKRPQAGYLASLRDVVCHRGRLDDLEHELVVEAEQLMGDETRVIYQFALRAGEAELLSGRATVVLDAGG